ncbi:glycosyltransferase family 2 protein [uncultured Pseudodesulfovibrio sp.]|uniref:glycosyltransferase family 2 protein n=1 Tax=uncultured Pseudodesulfovibrio sp. TaxID=2035858 RepID=UPI0029C66BE2|nr:glycosyltransferase family 2 protein [uncultured Pseudodesulfovibrio sp.]
MTNIFELYKKSKADHRQEYIDLYDARANERTADFSGSKGYFYDKLRELVSFYVKPGKRVLAVNADAGHYLTWTEPSYGVGIETAPGLVDVARKAYPEFTFNVCAPEEFEPEEQFDYIIIVDAVNDMFDVQMALEKLRPACHDDTRIIITWYNFFWKPLLQAAEKWGMKRPSTPQNWLSKAHIQQIVTLAGYEQTAHTRKILLPYKVPVLSNFINNYIGGLPLINHFCLMNLMVARPLPVRDEKKFGVSVIVPCKDEADNIEAAVLRTPQMGKHTELIFCDDNSTDGTPDVVKRMQKEHPDKDIKLVNGPGICKSENVWTGFNAATQDIVMILDGDLTVPPEDLPKFYNALATGKGEFINGTRSVYPMRDDAMRLANIFGNKAFSMLFSHILSQSITDTLCGTKVLWRKDWLRVRDLLGTWGINDRWGDYELIFGAARLGLKHQDLPVRYMERVHGETKMTGRLKNAMVMLRMCMAAFKKFK